MTYPHVEAEKPSVEFTQQRLHWTCPECTRSVFAPRSNDDQLPCAELPWARSCNATTIASSVCG